MDHYRLVYILAPVYKIATFLTMQDDSRTKVQELTKWMVVSFNIMMHTNNHTLVRHTVIFRAMAILFNVLHPVIHKSLDLTLYDVLSRTSAILSYQLAAYRLNITGLFCVSCYLAHFHIHTFIQISI